MNTLRAFLESEGGKLAVVLVMLLVITGCAMVLHMTHHDPADTGRTLMSNAFTALLTLLLAKLK